MSNVIAVDIGGTRFCLGLFNDRGEELALYEGSTNRSGGRAWMLDQLEREFLEFQQKSGDPVRACGVSFGGPVDFAAQTVTSIAVPGWDNFPLSAWVTEKLGVPCLLDNDGNAGALGEYRFGAGRGAEAIFYVTLSTGIGGGFVSGGRLLRGKDALAGEVGHLPMADSGPVCNCGARGCLEALASGEAIGKMGQEWAARRTDAIPRMVELAGGAADKVTAREVSLAAAEGDPVANRIFRDAARWLGRGLLSVIRIVNPDKVILGGGVSQAGKLLLDPIREVIEEKRSPAMPFTTEIVIAELGLRSPLYGALAIALERLKDPDV